MSRAATCRCWSLASSDRCSICADGFDIAVMEIDGFAHPLSAVYCRKTLPYIEDLLAQGPVAAGVSFRCRADAARHG